MRNKEIKETPAQQDNSALHGPGSTCCATLCMSCFASFFFCSGYVVDASAPHHPQNMAALARRAATQWSVSQERRGWRWRLFWPICCILWKEPSCQTEPSYPSSRHFVLWAKVHCGPLPQECGQSPSSPVQPRSSASLKMGTQKEVSLNRRLNRKNEKRRRHS